LAYGIALSNIAGQLLRYPRKLLINGKFEVCTLILDFDDTVVRRSRNYTFFGKFDIKPDIEALCVFIFYEPINILSPSADMVMIASTQIGRPSFKSLR